jgi:hypothetical protein
MLSAWLSRGRIMSGHTCGSCHVERVVSEERPVVSGYVMRALECPNCKNVLKLVVRDRWLPLTARRAVS